MKLFCFFVISFFISLFATIKAQECVVLTSSGFPQIPESTYGDSHILEDFSPTQVRTVYIAAHIVRSSSGQDGISTNDLNDAISDLNSAYSNVMIQFVHDQTDYIDNDLYYTVSEQNFPALAQINLAANKLNVYFCPQGSGINGIAYLANNKCAVTNAAAINGSTLAHEIGHNFYLYHTHGNGAQEYVNGSNCTTAGDYLCDTPAEPYNDGNGISGYVYSNTCNYFGTFRDPNNELFMPDTHNFLGYSTASCRDSFTEQQIQKMNQTLTTILSYLINVQVPLANKINNNVILDEPNKPSTLTVIGGQTVNSGNNANLLDGNSYDIRTNQERFPSYSSYGNIKHNNWNGESSEFLLTENYTVNRSESPHRDANFLDLNFGRIELKLEGQVIENKGEGKFQDPWYVLSDGSQPGNYWKDFYSYYEPTGKEGASEKGVFLNQGSPNWTPPYYSVQAISPQQITLDPPIGIRNFSFYKWTAEPSNSASFQNATSSTSGVVFNSAEAIVNANMKGQGLSNTSDGISSPSQRKIVRTEDGRLHRVYESMDHVWYEMSGDNGQSWTLMNGGHPLDDGKGKNPSIAAVSIDNTYDYVVVVFQQNEGGIAGFDYSVQLNVFGGLMPNNPIPIYQRLQTATIYSSGYQYSRCEATPVVAMKPGVNTATVEVVWHTNEGLRIQDGGISYLNSPPYNKVLSPYMVPNTSLSSINPSIATHIQNNTSGYFYMVWAENNIIKYIDFHSRQFSQVIAVSNLDGYTYDSTASLIVLDDGLARICWKGTRVFAQIDPDGNIDISKQDNRTIFKGINSNRYWYFGNNVSSPNINKADDGAYYGIIWNQNENSTYFADNSLSTIRQITGLPGSAVALSNGPTSSSMYADIFNTASAPYYLKTSNSLNSYYIPQKPTAYYFASGREGTLTKDSAQFYFVLGDISVDDQAIDFVEIPDSIVFNSNEVLNSWLISQDFQLNNNSSFQYSIQYGIGDSSSAAACLANLNSYVSFKLQLVDAQTSEVIGTYDEVTFDQSNVYQYSSLSYQVNTSGIGNRTVYLRLVTDDNINAGYSLGEIYAINNVLGKATVKTKNFDGLNSVTKYTLSQNFPNPYNPATTINYQMPEDGFVTLKVYDILGKEVATLVNEQKNQGRYSVNFDASRLASGVYIYQLRVNDYVSSKKMLLLK